MTDSGLNALKEGARIYFIGIGGISMSGLALLAKGYGFNVGGSDMNPSERTEMLADHGIKIYNSQVAENIAEFLPKDTIYVTINSLGENDREIIIEDGGRFAAAWD